MNKVKEKLDLKATWRANFALSFGLGIMVSQFAFIFGGTFFLFSWDVMEPIAYLMLTGNMTVSFAYFAFWKQTFSPETLQEIWKQAIARRIYKSKQFDLEAFRKLEEEVSTLKSMLRNSV